MGPPKFGAPGNCPICPPLKPALTGVEILLLSVLCQYNYCGSVGNCAGIVLGCIWIVSGVFGESARSVWSVRRVFQECLGVLIVS